MGKKGSPPQKESKNAEIEPAIKVEVVEIPQDETSAPSAATGEKSGKTATKRKPRSRKRGKRRSARDGPDDDVTETEQLKSRFLKRSGNDSRSKRARLAKLENERGPIAKRSSNDAACTYEIVNPSTYDNLFSRLEETNFNKPVKLEGPYLENAPWICCFCQRKPCVDDLGDLFGPYYVKLSPPTFWPPFVDQSDEKVQKPSTSTQTSDVNVDLWFHGDCVYWAPGVLLRGRGMTGLEENLLKFWKEECSHCGKVGANMACKVKGCGKSFHYPCAIDSGSLLKEPALSLYCDGHRKLVEKRKN